MGKNRSSHMPFLLLSNNCSRHNIHLIYWMSIFIKNFFDILDFLKSTKQKYKISAYPYNYILAKVIAKQIKVEHRDAVIVFGELVAGNDNFFLNCTEVDIVVTSSE